MKKLVSFKESSYANECISSLELVKQINIFREQEGNKSELMHKNLLAVIRDEFEDEIGMLEIKPTPYIHPQNGQKYEMYNLTLNQAKQVLMRESKFVRKAMIQYIDSLENELKNKFKVPTTFREALLLAAEQQEVIESQQKRIEIMAPKEEFFDAVADSKDAISMNDVAKVLGIKGMGRNNLFEFLRQNNILMNNNTPYQKYVDCGYFRVIEQSYMKNNEPYINTKTLVYQKGLDFIRKTINKQLNK
ncbi:MAG: phage antirepressor KilAC domain-containing protein [Bacteroidales bacterium]